MHLFTPGDLKKAIPLSEEAKRFVQNSRETICSLLNRQDPRLLIISGPCSIHNVDEALLFADKLKNLAKEVEDSCFVVMRAYIEKPRTRKGWKGLVYDPHLNGSEDLSCGLTLSRTLFTELAEMGVPAALEFLTPHLANYFEDCVSWGCIGARTTTSQIHRLLASHLPLPIGFKNTVEGNIEAAIDAVDFSRHGHTFLHTDDIGKVARVKSIGNPNTHVVLRGSLLGANYDRTSVLQTLNALRRDELPPRVLIDCSHGNSQKKCFQQKEVFQSVLEQVQDGNSHIIGMMLESYLEAGSQKVLAQLSEMQVGVSITDPCLDFASTAELISSTSMSLTHS